jgi:hypothetical protein
MLVVAVGGLTLVLAGCGGGGEPSLYTLAATKTCLAQHGVATGGKLDFVAGTATGGGLVGTLAHNSVTVAFGQDLNGGIQIYDAYERFAFQNVRAGLPTVLFRYDNAVTLWHFAPSGSDLQLVTGCLK